MKQIYLIAAILLLLVSCKEEKSDDSKNLSNILINNSPWVLDSSIHEAIETCNASEDFKQFYDPTYYEVYNSDETFHIEYRNLESCSFSDTNTDEGSWTISDDGSKVIYTMDGKGYNSDIITLNENKFVYAYYGVTYYLIPKK